MRTFTREAKVLGSIDSIVRYGANLLILGWLRDGKANLSKVNLSITNNSFTASVSNVIKYDRNDLLALKSTQKLQNWGDNGFLLHCNISKEQVHTLEQTNTLSCSLMLDDEELIRRDNVPVSTLEEAQTSNAFSWVGTEKVVSLLSTSNQLETALIMESVFPKPLKLHIDQAICISEGGVLLKGWAENASLKEFYWISGNDGKTSPVQLIEFSERHDVRKHLDGKTATVSSPDICHGFTCLIDFPETNLNPKKIQLALKEKNDWKISTDIPFMEQRSFLNSLEKLLQLACSPGKVPSKHLALLFSKFAERHAKRNSSPVKEVVEFGPVADAKISTSIIIPFYKEYFFIKHILMMQDGINTNVEWIFVCDDPSIEQNIESYISNRQSALKQPVKLVKLKENNGFATANNVGFSYCIGEYILLMNSDIYCDNFDWLDYSIRLFENEDNKGKTGAIGYSLQFEDGTIQHDGMRFTRDILYENSYLTTHPNKGLPSSWTDLKHRSVEACTAALLLLPRQVIQDGEIFLSKYIKGDFEDSDLNLRLRKQGYEIVIVETPGIFHLERQSIKLMGKAAQRSSLTLLNCQTFNIEWSEYIDQYHAENLS